MKIIATFNWINIGNVMMTEGNTIVFPLLPKRPGIYRFHCLTETDSWLYIGEADNLKTRMNSYGKPGRTQSTNIRLNTLFQSSLDDQRITLEIVIAATLEVDNNRLAADLNDVFVRRLVEDAAIVASVMAGTRILNKRRSKYVTV